MKKTYKIFFVLLIIAIFFYFNPIIKTYANSEEDNISQNIDNNSQKETVEKKDIVSKDISLGYKHTGKLKQKNYIRKKAKNNSKTIIDIKKGKKVTILDEKNNYYKVSYKKGKKVYKGYIKKKYIVLDVNIKIIEGRSKTIKPILTPKNSTDKLKYITSNKKIAKVNSSGVITGKKNGEVKITAITESGKKDYVIVKVKKRIPIKKIKLDSKYYMILGEKYKIPVSIYPSNTTDKVKWSSSNEEIATVDKNGKVTAKKEGTVYIKVINEYGKSSSTKVYITTKKIMQLNKKAATISATYDNVTQIIYGKSILGEQLEAYEIRGKGNNSKVMFIETSVHGFEDEYPKDAKVLVKLANTLIEYYAKNPNKLKDYTLVIVPCANPDGTLYGKNNYRETNKKAFGRCTYKGIDINRDFNKSRFNAKESRALKKLMKKYSDRMKVNIDLHGWEDSVLGDKNIVKQFRKYVGNKKDKTGQYGKKSFIIQYTLKKFNAHSSLVEFKNSKSVKAKNVEKALNAIMKIY